MKKHFKTFALILLTAILVLSIFTACDMGENATYSVTFIADGKEIKTVKTSGFQVIELPDAPAKDGYDFAGWYLDRWQWQKPFDGSEFASSALTGDLKVYACYVEKKDEEALLCEIAFYAFGEVVDTVTTAGNETLTLPAAPTKEDYDFKGWYLDENVWSQPFTADYFADKATTGNVSVYARYEEKQPVAPTEYAINFYADGELVDTVMSAGNEIIILPNAPEKTDYEFKGWYLDDGIWSEAFTADYFADKATTGNVSVYARYEEKQPVAPTEYAINFYADGELVDTVMSAGNEIIILPTAPEKTDYEFKGWYLDDGIWNEAFTADYFADKATTGNVSVYARYEEKQPVAPTEYAINFYADGELVDTVMSAGNEIIILPTAPEKTDYEFKGWYLDDGVWSEAFTADYFADRATTGNVSVYACYEYVPTFTVSFDTDGGTELDPVKVNVIETEPFTEKVGYDFDGWYLDAEKTDRVIFPFNVQHDCTFYAKWTEKAVTFTFDSNNYISGISGKPANGVLNIPATVNGVKVKGISDNAFIWNTDIVSVTIDPSITYIGFNAFKGCSKLVSINIPYGVTRLYEGVFSYCSGLKHVDLPDTLKYVDRDVFSDSGITSITLPESVESIGQYAFKNCKSLASVDLGQVEILEQGLFQNCTSLTSIEFPDTLRKMDGNYMFMGCYKLAEVIYPDVDVPLNYNFVHNTMYYNNAENWVDDALYVGNHLVTVNREFRNKTSFSVRQGTVTIARLAFYENNLQAKLASLTLPEGLKNIGERAFEDCALLGSVNIPDSVIKIGADAFNNTLLLKSGQSNYVDGWLINYELPSGQTVVEIAEGTVGIVDGQITDSQNSVTEVKLPSTLKYIGADNFNGMMSLTTINIPAALVSIGEKAFYSGYLLDNVDFSKCTSLTSIGQSAFSWCKTLSSLYIPRSVEYIGDSAFNQTKALTLYIERGQDEIPDGWDENWNFTYAENPIPIVWGAQSAS